MNKSWICDLGRASYKEIGLTTRITGARQKGATWEGVSVSSALDTVAARLKEAGSASAFLASPQGSNEDLFAFKALADAAGGLLDFRVGDPQAKLKVRSDNVLLREDRNPNTQGCLDQGLGRSGVAEILAACGRGAVKALVLQGPELLRVPEAVDALAKVPFIAVMATHEGPELDRAHLVLPAALWVEGEGTFTNYARRLQRFRRAVAAPGDALPLSELASGILGRLGKPLGASSAREIFALVTKSVAGYAGLDYKTIGPLGHAIDEGRGSRPRPRLARERPRRHRRPQHPARSRPHPRGHVGHLQELLSDPVPEAGFDHPVPRAEAQDLGPLPRRSPPDRSRGRHPEVRGLLHVRDRVPGRVHLHRGRRAARSGASRSTPPASRSTSFAASTAASASTPAPRRPSS